VKAGKTTYPWNMMKGNLSVGKHQTLDPTLVRLTEDKEEEKRKEE
jgi:hypothetical protein